MKLIILEGIPTTGKSVLGRQLKKDLVSKDHKVFYFNDDSRNKLNIDILDLLKKEKEFNLEDVKKHLYKIIKILKKVQLKESKECIFIIDRFHFSYLSFLECKVKKFKEIEKEISKYTYFILLNYKNFNKDKIYDRMVKSLKLRGPNHGFTNYFNILTSKQDKGNTPKERIYNHYFPKFKLYKQSLKESILENKKLITIDYLINKKDYTHISEELKKEIILFLDK